MVVILHARLSYPGPLVPIGIAQGGVAEVSEGIKRTFSEGLVEVSEGRFQYKGSIIKVIDMPFFDSSIFKDFDQLRDIIADLQAKQP